MDYKKEGQIVVCRDAVWIPQRKARQCTEGTPYGFHEERPDSVL
jgi:hypothetical protein